MNLEEHKEYLIKNHGFDYRPNAAGYTSAPPAKLSEGIPGFYSQEGEAVFLLSETGEFYKCVYDVYDGRFYCSDILLSNLESINFLLNLTQISKEETFDKLFEERREAWELRGGDLDELRKLVNDFLN